jgi:predicted lipoprotein with Yx(FWY)xxD motif
VHKLLLPVALIALVLGFAACGDDDDEDATTPEVTETAEPEAPTAGAQDPPLVGGFYEGEPVDYLLTDVNIEEEAEGLSEATGFPVSYVERLGDVPESATAKLYLFMNGVEGPNPFGFQANVIDSVPGEPGYSPLWLVHAVEWTDESQARELRSEEEILEAEQAGELTVTKTELIKNSPVVPSEKSSEPTAAGDGGETGVEIATGESQFGTILFDGDDRAIYLFDKESSERSECYGACAEAWPPVLTDGEPEANAGVDAELIGTTERDDGSTQVTYAGHPLYYYVDDPRGEVLCHNVDEFGGLWLVVDPGGEAVH